MIMLWKKKPVIVEVIQWTGDNAQEMRKFGFEGYLAGLEVGAYIVRTESGKLELFSESAFYATYERHLVWTDNI